MFGYKLYKEFTVAEMMNSLTSSNIDLKQENDSLKEQIALLTEKSDKASVRLDFDETFENVTPVITFNKEKIEKLVELQYLSYSQIDDKFAIQLALIMMAEDTLNQIINAFSEEKVDV
jgi:hypothetical protein